MPMFDYKCTDCGEVKNDELVKSYDVIVLCNCCGTPMEKLLSAPTWNWGSTGSPTKQEF